MTTYYKFDEQKMFNRDRIWGIDVYVLTAYFVDPKSICRSNDQRNRKETCKTSGLWLQNGTNPIRHSFLTSINENEISSTKWVQGQCFPTMGKHFSIHFQRRRRRRFVLRYALLVRQSS